jgi:glycosyltransferase involved in cell wall biosynthesis
MRILHVVSSLDLRHGGPPRAIPEMCRALARAGHEVVVYSTDEGIDPRRVPLDQPIRGDDGVETWYFTTQRTGLYGLSMSMVRALRENLRSFDVVHTHSLYRFSATIAAHYCRRYRIPYVLFPHGSLDPFLFYRHRWRKNIYEALFERRNLARAAAVQFSAEDEMRLAAAVGIKCRGVVVSYGVQLDIEPTPELREQFRREWPETRGKLVILFLSRISLKKGLDLLAKAFGAIARARPDVHLFVAGPDDEGYGKKVRQWLAEEGVLGRATFAGMLLGERKAAALAGADLFALPSYTENFGIAITEASAAGLPVIISNKVNISREFAEARAGLVINCDVDELTHAMATLLDDPELRRAMGAAGRNLVAERFNWPAVTGKLIDVYRDAIAANRNLHSAETSLA